MNRLLMILILLLILVAPQAWAQSTQYPDPNRETMWNSMTDSMHTIGQTPQQARITRMRLRNTRAIARINSNNQAAKAQHQAQINAWRAAQESSN